MIPSFSVLAGAGGAPGMQGSGGTTSSFASWLGDIPIIGPLLEFLAESALALTQGLDKLYESKDIILGSLSWLPDVVFALIVTALTVIITMKVFGR